MASRTSTTGPFEPGSTGRPASLAAAFASTLSPIRDMTSGDGPTNVMSLSAHARANSGFSERNP